MTKRHPVTGSAEPDPKAAGVRMRRFVDELTPYPQSGDAQALGESGPHERDTLSRAFVESSRAGARRPGIKAAATAVGAVPVSAERSAHACDFMGGKRLHKTLPRTRADVHAAIVRGLPYAALVCLMESAVVLSQEEVAAAIGISTRTLRRQKDDPKKLMPADLASKTWLFAETLAKSSEAFGGREAAERWMAAPAMGLDGARPIELLRTLQGAELVNEFLGRLEYGVYN